MSTRYTVKDVRSRFWALLKRCSALGMNVSKVQLQEGASAYGRAYRIYDDGRGFMGTSQGFIGFTAREACHTLGTMLEVIWALEEAGLIIQAKDEKVS